jgi:hypothetical protein
MTMMLNMQEVCFTHVEGRREPLGQGGVLAHIHLGVRQRSTCVTRQLH